MDVIHIDLSKFKGREESLKKIKRYNMYSPMFYRTNVYIHSIRVNWIVEHLLPIANKAIANLNSKKACILALIHDDAEIITGDIPLGKKLYMSKEQLDKIEEDEARAIDMLSSRYPRKINEFFYKDLLYEALKKDKPDATIEAQLVSCADKCDALGEALHEIYAGNKDFCADKEGLEKGVNPINKTIKILTEFSEKFPKLTCLFGQSDLFNDLQRINEHEIVKKGKLYNPQSIHEKTGCSFYDIWKEILIKNGGKIEIDNLTIQRES